MGVITQERSMGCVGGTMRNAVPRSLQGATAASCATAAGLLEDEGWNISDLRILGLSWMNHTEGVVSNRVNHTRELAGTCG